MYLLQGSAYFQTGGFGLLFSETESTMSFATPAECTGQDSGLQMKIAFSDRDAIGVSIMSH